MTTYKMRYKFVANVVLGGKEFTNDWLRRTIFRLSHISVLCKIPQFRDAESQHEVDGEALIWGCLRAVFWLGYDLGPKVLTYTRCMVDWLNDVKEAWGKNQRRKAFQVARQTDKKNISVLWKAKKIEKKKKRRRGEYGDRKEYGKYLKWRREIDRECGKDWRKKVDMEIEGEYGRICDTGRENPERPLPAPVRLLTVTLSPSQQTPQGAL